MKAGIANIPPECKTYACLGILKSHYNSAFLELESRTDSASQKNLLASYRTLLYNHIEKIGESIDILRKLQESDLQRSDIEESLEIDIQALIAMQFEGIENHFNLIRKKASEIQL